MFIFVINNTTCNPVLVEGDILPNKLIKRRLRRNALQLSNGDTTYLWKDGFVPYVISDRLSQRESTLIEKAMEQIQKYTCIEFKQRTNEYDFVHFVKREGCYANIGRQGGEQIVSIGTGCAFKLTVIHEILHVLGMYHEQTRLDRGLYLNILWWNIQTGAEKNFETYFHNDGINSLNYPYDYHSITHYDNKEFSNNGKNTMEAFDDPQIHLGNKNGLSKYDIKKINEAYKCRLKKLKNACKDKFEVCKSYKRHCKLKWFAENYCQKTCGACKL